MFHQLPLPVYGIIRDYIIDYGAAEGVLSLNEQINNWRNFINCSKHSCFQEVKKCYNYYHFSQVVTPVISATEENPLFPSHISSLSEELQDRFSSEVINPFNQVSVGFQLVRESLTTGIEAGFFNIHSCFIYLNLFERISSNLNNVQYVSLMNSPVSFYGPLDLSILQSCCFVNLSFMGNLVNNENLHFLSNVKRLYLDGCYEISDVSCLSKVYDLSLGGCNKIKDISMLNHVYRLNVRDCHGIIDISKLNHVCCLNISFNWKITTGLPTVNRLKEICLSNSCFLHSMNAFLNKPALFFRLRGKFSVSYDMINVLEKSYRISLEDSDLCPSLSMFQQVRNLSILSSTLPSHLIASLPKLQYLFLDFCESLDLGITVDFLSLPALEELTVKNSFFKSLEIITSSTSRLKRISLSECQIEDNKILIYLPSPVERVVIKFRKADPDLQVVMIGKSEASSSGQSLFHSNYPHKLQYIVKTYR
jgi:hypothetical protein